MTDPTPLPIPVTDDTLLAGKVIFRQPAEGYRAAIDPVFLAAAVPDGIKGRVLDLGCGAGAAMLCLARRRSDLTVVGLERDVILAQVAQSNVEANEFGNRVTVIAGDLLNPPRSLIVGSFDAVIANPPYLDAEAADPPPDPRKAAATVESEADLTDWTRAAARFVKPKGMVLFIHRFDRAGELCEALERAGCGGAVTIPLWPRTGAPPKRAVVTAIRGDNSPRSSGRGLILHDYEGRFTPQAEAILREASPLTAR
jgi:tRNA1(Val) A37 N6-methylase TrmN6